MPVRGYRPDAVSELLRDSVDAMVGGRGSLVFVTGEPGIGKTTAAQAAAAMADARGAEVLWAACWPDDAEGHGPWRALLADLGEAGAAPPPSPPRTQQLHPSAPGPARGRASARLLGTLP